MDRGLGGKSSKSRGSIDFTLETVMSMVLVLIIGALLMYFMFVYLYQGKITGWLGMLKDTFSNVLNAQVS